MEHQKISELQNQPDQLRQLAAQRQLYAEAKQVFFVHLFAATILPFVLLPVAWFWYPSLKGYMSISGFILMQFDLLGLTPWQERLREKAAKIQEQFDCKVLQLPGNEKKIGSPATRDDINENSKNYEIWSERSGKLTDWYPTETDKVPIEMGRIVCQRTNIWWDAKLRRRVAKIMRGSFIILWLAVLGWGVAEKATLPDFFLGMLLPVSPLINFCLRQWLDQIKTADRLDRLRDDAEKIWKNALAGTDPAELTRQSRELQDEIYDHRRKAIPVPDLLYALTRSKQEEQMNDTAEQMIQEALQALQRRA